MYRTDDKILTDKEIIDGFLNGNQETYRVVNGWMDEIIQRILWSGSIQPDDIRSDTLYKLLINFRSGRFRHKSTLKAYVQQVTRFTIIDAVRRNRRQPVLYDCDPPDHNTPFSEMINEEGKNIFNRIWDIIDEKCRDLWMMIFKDNKNYKEIAKKLKLSENTIKSRIFRCKEEAIRIRKQIT